MKLGQSYCMYRYQHLHDGRKSKFNNYFKMEGEQMIQDGR